MQSRMSTVEVPPRAVMLTMDAPNPMIVPVTLLARNVLDIVVAVLATPARAVANVGGTTVGMMLNVTPSILSDGVGDVSWNALPTALVLGVKAHVLLSRRTALLTVTFDPDGTLTVMLAIVQGPAVNANVVVICVDGPAP